MNKLFAAIIAAVFATVAVAPAFAAEAKKDIADHRAMAEAHLNAAKCFEAGKSEKECHGQLAKDCKGLAIGKYCGMKHSH